MVKYIPGVRLHDYGRGTPEEMFARVKAAGYDCVQLAYRAAITGIREYEDIGPEIIERTLEAKEKYNMTIAVLGTYVELAMNDEAVRSRNVEIFKKQLAVCKALGAWCIGTETTSMKLQPPGTTRERGQYLLCKSLDEILPEAERLGVTVGIEAVSYHSMNTPEAVRRILDSMQSPALKVIFDAGNILTADQVSDQEQLWQRTGELIGEKIAAIHFKGEGFDAEGNPLQTDLEHSVIDWDSVFRMMKKFPQTIPVLREEAIPEKAASDLREMHRLFRI